jgi:hypothetical protein
MEEPMTSMIIPVLIPAVVIGLAFALAGGPLLFVLVGLAVLLAIGWFFVVGASGRTPREVARGADKQEFLGPGGPDDPTG